MRSPSSRSSSRRTVARSPTGWTCSHELGALRPDRRSLTAVGESLSAAAGRPAAGPDARRGAPQRLPARGTGDHRGAVGAGPARAAAPSSARPRTPSTAGSPGDGSDFLAYLRLWDHLEERRDALSGSKFRRELRERVPALPAGPRVVGPARPAAPGGALVRHGPERANPDWAAHADRIHQSVLAGLLSQVGMADPLAEKKKGEKQRGPREYLGARGAKFVICPGSALAKKPPRWVMAAELVETTRLWARTVAPVQPEWIEPLAAHLVKRTYSEPHWSRKRASAVATERVTLHGIPLVADRTVAVREDRPRGLPRPVPAARARRGRLGHPAPLLPAPTASCSTTPRSWSTGRGGATSSWTRTRSSRSTTSASRRTSCPGRHFDTWWRKESRRDPELLDFTEEMLTTEAARGVDRSAYPDHVVRGRAHAAAVLRVRARAPHRRRDRRRAGGRAAPGGPDAVHVAGARDCARSWSPR